jgi:hypothetical protein
MIVCVYKGVHCASLYIGREGKGAYLVLVSYNRRVLILLQNLVFLVSQLG